VLGDGSVFSWGFGWSGQLGLGSDATVYVPTRVEALPPGKRAVAVAAGGVHSLALCDDGTVFSWGSGQGGRLGLEQAGRAETKPACLRIDSARSL
jgi:alpha-tubulin suppressor-like RCC1 family protein